MKFSFRYKKVKVNDMIIYRPMIPVILSHNGKKIKIVGILDSGSDFLLIPKEIADYLTLKLGKKVEIAEGIGRKIKTTHTSINLRIKDEKKNVQLPNIKAEVLLEEGLEELIIGRIPFFQEFNITFKDNSKRVELIRTKRR